MLRAGSEIWGERLSWEGVEAAGGLDPALFEEAMERSGIPISADDHHRFRELYIECLREELETRRADVHVMPGVPEVLAELCERREVVLGLLTGNYGPSAHLKLAAAELSPEWFEVSAFGDEAPSRPELVVLAMKRYEAQHRSSIETRQVVVIGDTPRDVHCALRNDCIAFAVATGMHSESALREAGAHIVVPDLADPAPLFRLLDTGA